MTTLLGFLMRHSRGSFLLAVLSGVAGGACGVGVLAMIPVALRDGGAHTGRLALVFAALCLGTIVGRVAMHVAMIRIAQGSVAGLVRDLCERIVMLPLARFEANDPAALTAVLTEDVAALTAALTAVPILVINLTVFAGCFVYLGVVSRAALFCTLIFAAPAILTQQILSRRGYGLMARARTEQDELVGHFRALVEGFKELKLNRDRREAFLDESIRAASGRVRDRSVSGHSLFAAASGWGQFLYFSYVGFLVFGLPAFVDLPRETLAAAVLTVVFAISPLDSALNWLPVVARAGASMDRIEALGLSLEPARLGGARRPTGRPGPLRGPIVMEGVTHTYPSEQGGEGFTLGPVDLTVRPGEMLFISGGNGSGKTTLVKLLTGLYPPGSGTIRHDGRAVDADSLDAHRRLFTVVFADGFLFPSLLGLEAPDLDARAGDLLAELGLEGLVSVEGGAFSTTDLSMGQRKRLALLSACLEDRPVMVLDEWASYQDPAFKRAFYREILPALKARGKTLIVISHDEEYYFIADRVVHLSAGMLSGADPAGDADSLSAPPIDAVPLPGRLLRTDRLETPGKPR
jgi:putative ATP-binding cassette transporter